MKILIGVVFVIMIILGIGIITIINVDDGITSYYIETFPSLPNYSMIYDENYNIINEIARDSFDEWSKLNPDLIYEQVFDESKADIRIHWKEDLGIVNAESYVPQVPSPGSNGQLVATRTLGYAESYFGKYDIFMDYVDLNCERGDAFISKESLKNTLTHEIGHTLGLDHSPDKSNIMYGGDSHNPFDNLGYAIPNNYETYMHVGEQKANEQYALTGNRSFIDQINCMYGVKITLIPK